MDISRFKMTAAAVVVAIAAVPVSGAADCYDGAAAHYSINPDLLRAISTVESSRSNRARNINTNGSEDVCAMQINSVHFPDLARYGITREHLLADECTCISVGAWILAREIAAVGPTWLAVARYHSRTPDIGRTYAYRVWTTFHNLTRTP